MQAAGEKLEHQDCIESRLLFWAGALPESPALLGIGTQPLSYAGLYRQIEETVQNLNALGIGRRDRVALALPNGPDSAACCLSVASGATAIPLNPASTASEFSSYFSDLRPEAIVVDVKSNSPAADVADSLGIRVLRMISDSRQPAGTFQLEGSSNGRTPQRTGFAQAEDVALLLQTSGTTSRPKMARLTHRNLCAGARNNQIIYGLTPQDRCLNLTPMYLSQGLVLSVLTSVLSGGSVVCTPGLHLSTFFDWLEAYQPTWFSTPPTNLQSILTRGAKRPELTTCLRFIRSSSSSLSQKLADDLEEFFVGVPVLDTYGTTEASSSIAVNPSGRRKAGSAGVAAGACEIAIMDANGTILPPGEVGEVVIRGPNVIAGYENDPEANATSFEGEWLRTGDLGTQDADGYLFLKGRKKEIINRGGQKISPQEIDDVLLAHPAVAEVATFPIPNERLGEEIGSAVVLRDRVSQSQSFEMELREYAAARLADFKVPRRFFFLDQIPKSQAGKLQRLRLAEQLGASEPASTVPKREASPPMTDANIPSGLLETLLTQIWEDMLDRRPIGMEDDFFELGGDSLLGARLLARVDRIFGKKLTVAWFFEAPTIRRMAKILQSAGSSIVASQVIGIRSSGSHPPLYVISPQPLIRALTLRLLDDQPLFGISDVDSSTLPEPYRLEDIAARQVAALREFQPEGPYLLAGWCADGIIAYEMAQQLRAQGQSVPLVVMFDSFNRSRSTNESRWFAWSRRLSFHLAALSEMNSKRAMRYCLERMAAVSAKFRESTWRVLYKLQLRTNRRLDPGMRMAERIVRLAVNQYCPQPYPGRVLLIRAEKRPLSSRADAAFGWRNLIDDLTVTDVPGNHRDIFGEPNVAVMANSINAKLLETRGLSEANQDDSPWSVVVTNP